MCSAILGDMNNLYNLGVIRKYLCFLYAMRDFPLPVLGLFAVWEGRVGMGKKKEK
jgi:hypothetical protein